MQTHLMIDKQSLIYDNQQPQWQRFVWPADTVASGASLSWITNTGTRIYGDYRGVWGIIRYWKMPKLPLMPAAPVLPVSWKTQTGSP